MNEFDASSRAQGLPVSPMSFSPIMDLGSEQRPGITGALRSMSLGEILDRAVRLRLSTMISGCGKRATTSST